MRKIYNIDTACVYERLWMYYIDIFKIVCHLNTTKKKHEAIR